MQFISKGPNVPDELIRAHSMGNVIFFCGAGISCNANLPDFKKLVKKIYKDCSTEMSSIEKESFRSHEYDRTLALLEQRINGGKTVVRKAVESILQVQPDNKHTKTHQALLTLSHSESGQYRLVTTNYDRLFHLAALQLGVSFIEHVAPSIPVAKRSRWDGVVFLHGLLPVRQGEIWELNKLVLTSGDFGLAYLTERWAARFVSDLFKNFVVCFVGYSLNDPVLRYMIDALSADRSLGEKIPKVWAFVTERNSEKVCNTMEQWNAKGVVPIICNSHSLLHQTIQEWANVYRDGIDSRKKIIHELAPLHPQLDSVEEGQVNKLIWAISEPNGQAAQYFAEFRPRPPIEWLLNVFSKPMLSADDLANLGLLYEHDLKDLNQQKFSLINVPGNYLFAPYQQTQQSSSSNPVNNVQNQLLRWMCRHLNDSRLLIWLIRNIGFLNSTLKIYIQNTLDQKSVEVENSNNENPEQIDKSMRLLWSFYLRHLICSYGQHLFNSVDFYRWKSAYKVEGLSFPLKAELIKMLTPMMSISELRYARDDLEKKEKTISDYVSWELVLGLESAKDHLQELSKDEEWNENLPDLFDYFQLLLEQALEMSAIFNGSEVKHDISCMVMPSIENHPQNQKYAHWTLLIELIRDAWLRINESDSERAKNIIYLWMAQPDLLFRRLALFAICYCKNIPGKIWVGWLTTPENLLWNPSLRREVLLLLHRKGKSLTSSERLLLERAILHNCPLAESDEEEEYRQNRIMLKLSWLRSSSQRLGKEASSYWNRFIKLHPGYKADIDERDSFTSWISTSYDVGKLFKEQEVPLPEHLENLCQWLEVYEAKDAYEFYEDSWFMLCRNEVATCMNALETSAREKNHWPLKAWRKALRAWQETVLSNELKTNLFDLLNKMPNDRSGELAPQISDLLCAFSKEIAEDVTVENRKALFECCRRLIINGFGGGRSSSLDSDPVTFALNHPGGKVYRALENLLFSMNLKRGDGLPEEFKGVFELFLNGERLSDRAARFLLVIQLTYFYQIDQDWSKKNLLPLFDWDKNLEATHIWSSYLCAPRLYLPLILDMKEQILQTISYIDDLKSGKLTFMSYLTRMLVEEPKVIFSPSQMQTSLSECSSEVLAMMLVEIRNLLDGIEDNKVNQYWHNRILRFWKRYWPKDRKFCCNTISFRMICILISKPQIFIEGYQLFKSWIVSDKHPSSIITQLKDQNIHTKYPKEVLELLSKIIQEKVSYSDLEIVLNQIIDKDPTLKESKDYIRLKTMF